MQCPHCKNLDTYVVDSRSNEDGTVIRRRRKCPNCSFRFTTYEKISLSMPFVIKKDGVSRVAYSHEKLKTSMALALRKRAVKAEDIDDALARIEKQLLLLGEKEVKSSFIGSLVLEELKALDPVAYLRFASVYLNYTRPEDFVDALKKLGLDKARGEQS